MTLYDYLVEGKCHKCNTRIRFVTRLSVDLGEYDVPCTGYCSQCGASKVRLKFNVSKTHSARNPLP